jgi:superfamily II DNA/RNA helicase
VSTVIHYDIPADHKDYLHRSGRTARAGKGGVVVSLITADQRRAVKSIQRAVGLDGRIHDPNEDWLTGETGSRVGEHPVQLGSPSGESTSRGRGRGGNGGGNRGGGGRSGNRGYGGRGGDSRNGDSRNGDSRGGDSRGGDSRGGDRPRLRGRGGDNRSGSGRGGSGRNGSGQSRNGSSYR